MRFTGKLALAFPLVIVGFIPIRLYLLPKMFTHGELELLDSEGDDGHIITTSQQEGMAKDEQSYDHPPLS